MLAIKQRVRAIFRGNPASVGLDPPRMSAPEREWIVRAIRREKGVSYFERPRKLACALGVTIDWGSIPNAEGEVNFGRAVFLRPACDARHVSLLTLHGIGHVILRDAHADHNESDAWLITGELVLPARCIFDVDQVRRLHAPDWFVRDWMKTRGLIRREVVQYPEVAFP